MLQPEVDGSLTDCRHQFVKENYSFDKRHLLSSGPTCQATIKHMVFEVVGHVAAAGHCAVPLLSKRSRGVEEVRTLEF